MSEHLAVEPTAENRWASWWCPDCKTSCASDNPCDCCDDAAALVDEMVEDSL